MKLTNEKIRSCMSGYNNSARETFELPFTTLYKIRKNMGRLEESYKPASETLQDIIKKYTKIDESGKTVYTNEAKFASEVKKLNDIENEVDITPIPIEEFGDSKATPAFMNAIYFMLKD